MPLRSIATVVVEPFGVFEYAVPTEVFGLDRTPAGVPAFDYRVCTPRPGPVASTDAGGARLQVRDGLEALAGVDLVVLASTAARSYDPGLLAALRRAHEDGATILSVCSGVFVLAATGLLDGRTAACHWFHAEELRGRHPAVRVDADTLFADEGSLVTSAGTAAGIDACLHLVRRELGGGVANEVARRMVVPPQRDGGQRQFVATPIPAYAADRLAPLLDWVLDNLDRAHTTASLARRAAMSERTFARRFADEVGETPHRWLVRQRVASARRLLEASDLPVDDVAARVGFGSATVLRDHLRRATGLAPGAYRARFSTACPAAAPD